ncbi:hypothetical protein [Streptosporangium amethystogenes]|uniref:hypothetical protein n=1 Tax=Streptosporangium amethystogenes TaxID=2002 RepID=UPI000AB9ACB6
MSRHVDVVLATGGDGFAASEKVADTFSRGAKVSGAKVVLGPAARPLPRLPIAVDAEGCLIAEDDLSVPVGPGYWERGEAEVRQKGGTE